MKAAEATRRKRFIIEHSRGKIYLWKAASLSNLVANGQKFGHIWRIGGGASSAKCSFCQRVCSVSCRDDYELTHRSQQQKVGHEKSPPTLS